jgi:hypothetical protein
MSSFGTSSTANPGATLAKAATNEHPRVATSLELKPQSIDIASNIKEMLYTKAETLRIDNTPTLMICQRELRVLGEVVPHILNGNTPVSRTAVDLREDFSGDGFSFDLKGRHLDLHLFPDGMIRLRAGNTVLTLPSANSSGSENRAAGDYHISVGSERFDNIPPCQGIVIYESTMACYRAIEAHLTKSHA